MDFNLQLLQLQIKMFIGVQVSQAEAKENPLGDAEEYFYNTSQKQAEERLKRYVVLVQAMFRSKQAQEDYMRMKLTHEEALEKKIAFFFLF